MKSVISVLLLVCSMFVFTTASAVPPLWEATYQGTELNGAAGGATGAVGPSEAIDGEESIALGFNFPFAGINYTHISVDDDGAIVLMNADAVTPIRTDIWTRSNFQTHFSNKGTGSALPVIMPFNTFLNQFLNGGKVWFAARNDTLGGFTGDRAIITWENSSVGTPISASDITFQAQLLGNGTIIFSYVNVTDPNTANWQTKADQGIVVGITNGDGAWPTGSIDLSTTAPAAGGAEFGVGLIAYQIWCKNDTPNNPVSCMEAGLDRNNLFDLNDTSLVFNPDGATGFLVSDSIESGVGKGGTGICVTADGPGAPGAPALWEATYNDTELNGVAGGATGAMGPSEAIDGEESIALGFNFPFAGINYTHISVDDDGAIVLMNADAVTPIRTDIWNKANFQTHFSNKGTGSALPVIMPFNTFLNQFLNGGKVYFAARNDTFGGFTGDRAIITWENSSVGTPISASDITFQAQLLGNGTIIFSYVNVTDPNTANWQTKADQGIVVGITNGDGAWPTGSVNFSSVVSAAEFGTDLIAYEIWCKNDNPNDPNSCMEAGRDRNNLFDLDNTSIVFNPDAATGFLVSDSIESGAGKGGTGNCVAGSNNAPVITIVDVAGAITEGGTVSESGSIMFADPDLTDLPTATKVTKSVTTALTLTGGQRAAIENAFAITPDAGNTNNGIINWDFTIGNADLEFLAAGETVTVIYTITVNDGNGGTDTQDVTIDVTGSNSGGGDPGDSDSDESDPIPSGGGSSMPILLLFVLMYSRIRFEKKRKKIELPVSWLAQDH